MHKFVRNLITEWRQLGLPVSGEMIILAVSGGADSVSLLLAVADLSKRKKLSHQIIVAHFNHGLRGKESDADESFVERLARSLDFEIAVGKGKIPKKGNLEQNARTERYEFLRTTAAEYNAFAILTAHTMNDQAETFLMNLIRGSGPDGLAGMQPVRKAVANGTSWDISGRLGTLWDRRDTRDNGTTGHRGTRDTGQALLVRPLLRWAKRVDTEQFCKESGIKYRKDSMNEDKAYKRVRIRKSVLPMLAKINPKIVQTLANTAELLSEPGAVATGFLSDKIGLKELRELPKAQLYATLRAWLRSNRGNLRALGLKHIGAIERLIHSPKSGRTVELPNGERVVKHGGRLVFEKIKVEK